jgi:3-oxoacyl-[acyl-carrier protein] reductase
MTAPDDRGGSSGAPGRHPELRGRVAVVTGAAKGIGLGIARRLVAEGMEVVAADVDGPALDGAVTELARLITDEAAIVGVVGDLSRVAEIDRLFAEVAERGVPHLLVNNAAHLGRRRVLDEHQDLLDLQLATNVAGPYVCAQRAAAAMTAPTGPGGSAAGGVIVNVSSVGATRAHHQGLPYDVTKGAIEAMTRAMAVDLGPLGVRVNAVAPGVTRTERTRRPEDDPDVIEVAERIPIGRWGSVDDLAAAVAFLASDDASYITGHSLTVDGGISAQLSPRGPHAF